MPNNSNRFIPTKPEAAGMKKPVFLICLAVFGVAILGLVLTLILRSCNSADDAAKTQQSPSSSTSETYSKEDSIVPTIAIKGEPVSDAEEVVGGWALDEVTAYDFSDGGTGIMVTDNKNYAFTFTIEDGVMAIDFEDDGVRDCSYKCYLDDAAGTLTMDDTSTQRTYVLNKR